MEEERIPHKNHFHIHWKEAGKLDWERFDSREDAAVRAKELMRRDEVFAIVELDGDCPQCGALIREAFPRLG